MQVAISSVSVPASNPLPRKTLGIEQRLALGKLAELLSDPPIILQDISWVSEKFALGVKVRVDLAAVFASLAGGRTLDAKSLVYSVLRAAHSKGVLHYCLGELLALFVSRRAETGGSARDPLLREIADGQADSWRMGKRAAGILGYEWVMGRGLFGESTVVVLPLAGGLGQQEDTSKLRSTLEKRHQAALTAMRSAYDGYRRGGTDGYRQACEAARNALENVVRDLTGMDIGPGFEKVTGDDEKRSKLFKSVRDALSVWGTHAKDQPPERDTFLAIRMTEEVLVWVLKSAGEW